MHDPYLHMLLDGLTLLVVSAPVWTALLSVNIHRRARFIHRLGVSLFHVKHAGGIPSAARPCFT